MMMDAFDVIAKVVVIGDSTVGKTCLILRYTQDIFRDNFLPTIGVDFKTKTIFENNKKMKLQLWDTAGQERYDSLRKGFYRGAKGVIVVYDISRKDTFANVSKWLDDISANNVGTVCPVLGVIGNKSDLNDVRQVERKTGEELAKRVGATFGEVSAKTGDGIDETFHMYIKALMVHIDKETASTNVIDQSLDVSRDWTPREEPQCCSYKLRRISSTSQANGGLEDDLS